MDVNLQKYLAFVKAVEYKNFTKAAAVLNYSQSGISRMISDLEKEWNVTLLERNRAGVQLTSDGKELLPYAMSLCAEYEKLQTKVDDLHGLKAGLIRIGTFSSVATHWLPKVIKAFQNDYPQIEYEILLGDYTEIEKWIIERRVDFGFLRLPTLSKFETMFLAQDELMVRMAGKLQDVKGILIGALTDCDTKGRPGSAMALVQDALEGIDIPIIANVRAGHIKDPITIPLHGKLKVSGGRIWQCAAE